MTDYANPDPLTRLPLRKFEHFRVTTSDAPPVPLQQKQGQIQVVDDDDEHDNNRQTSIIACRVCQEHVSRYTCPRCDIPYCSVACYQSHSTTDEEFSCTEDFYQERVQSIHRLEQKAKQQDTRDILNRIHLQQQQLTLLGEGGDLEASDNNDMTEEDMMQMMELLSLLEQQEEDPTKISNLQGSDENQQEQQIAKLLARSPKLKAAFESAVARGDVLPLVLQPWNPWWRPVLGSSEVLHHSGIVEQDESGKSSKLETLDERLLNIQPFQALIGNKPLPNLTYNLLEVLYCICWTLRLYHGSENACNDPETALEAARMMVQTSSVLGEDARYESLEEVLIRVTEKTVASATASGGDLSTTPSWTVLGQDIAYLVSNPRFVGRALLEALDILQAAVAGLKKTKAAPIRKEKSKAATELSDLRRKRKKVEFFLSWSQVAFKPPKDTAPILRAGLSGDIRAWVEHWKPDDHDANETQDEVLETLLTPALSKQSSSSGKAQKPLSKPTLLIQERTTTRKVQALD